MNEVFVDTSAWLALINKSDIFHIKAIDVKNEILKKRKLLVTSEYIIVEIANCLSKINYRELAIGLINSIISSREIDIVRIDEHIFEKTWQLYIKRNDKEWGFTDCSSFIIMKQRNITEAFSCDKHFEQAGFNVLLK